MKGFRFLIMSILVFGVILGMCGGTKAVSPTLDWTEEKGYDKADKYPGVEPKSADLGDTFTYRDAPKAVITKIVVDNTPPSSVKEVIDDGAYTKRSDILCAKWSESFDKESGIKEYRYCIGTEHRKADVVNWTSVGVKTEVTHIGLNLQEGRTYYFTVKAINKAGIESDVVSSNGITVDTTRPDKPEVTDEGDYTGDNTKLYAKWETKDDISGIVEYEYCIGTEQGGTNVVNWTSAGTKTEVVHTGLNLQDGKTYYFTVKAKNGAGLWSDPGFSDGIIVDITLPGKPVVKIDEKYAKDKIHATWWSDNAVQGVTRYEYAIGTEPGGADIFPWTSVRYNTEVTAKRLRLNEGKTYYFSVRAIGEKGRKSPIGSSSEIIGDVSPPEVKVEVDTEAPYITKVNNIIYTNRNDKLPAKVTAKDYGYGSGIKEYWYAVSTSHKEEDIILGWIKTTPTDRFTIEGLSLKEGGEYHIGIKVIDNVGNERIGWCYAKIVVDTTAPTVRITSLPEESRIYGNGIYIEAEAEEKDEDEPDPEGIDIRDFKFQYRWGCGNWRNIHEDSIVNFHCGISGDHLVIRGWWDVTNLLDGGKYQLRAVATDQALNEGEGIVNVTIDKTCPNIGEFLVRDDVVTSQYIEFGNRLRVEVPPHTEVINEPRGEMKSIRILDVEGMEGIEEDFVKNTKEPIEEAKDWLLKEEGRSLIEESIYKFIGMAIVEEKGKGIEVNGMTEDLFWKKKVEIDIPYPDLDNDRVVDETNIPVKSLKVYKLFDGRWKEVEDQEVDIENKVVKVRVSSFSILALAGEKAKPSSDLDGAVIYPNPFNPNKAVHGVVKLIRLTKTSKVRIYTLSGELVKVIESDTLGATRYNPNDPHNYGAIWNGENEYGNPVASGLYFVLITDEEGHKKLLKLSIIRK